MQSPQPKPEFDPAVFLLKLVAAVIIYRLAMLTVTGGICAWWYRNRPPTLASPISPTCSAASDRADRLIDSTTEITLALLGGGGAAAGATALRRRRPPEDPPE
jgi:hypothetical protein